MKLRMMGLAVVTAASLAALVVARIGAYEHPGGGGTGQICRYGYTVLIESFCGKECDGYCSQTVQPYCTMPSQCVPLSPTTVELPFRYCGSLPVCPCAAHPTLKVQIPYTPLVCS